MRAQRPAAATRHWAIRVRHNLSLRTAGACRLARCCKLAFGDPTAFAQQRAKALQPIVLQADRDRAGCGAAAEAEAHEFRPAIAFPQAVGRHDIEAVWLDRIDNGSLMGEEIGNEAA